MYNPSKEADKSEKRFPLRLSWDWSPRSYKATNTIPEKETQTIKALRKLNFTSSNKIIPNMYTKILEVLQSTVELETDAEERPEL